MSTESDMQGRGGLIRLFVTHPTASNLLMAAMIAIGLFGIKQLNTQFFPTIEVPMITVAVSWPGASAEDVEENILDAIEPTIRFLDDVDTVIAIAREGSGVITVEFNAGADLQKAQADIEQAVAAVQTLPEGSEEPEIKRITFFEPVAKIAVSGPFDEEVLKAHAKTLRDGLLTAGLDKVDFVGFRDEEIWIRIREHELRRLDLTLQDVAGRVQSETRDLPSGILEGDVEMQLRALSDRRTPEALSDIAIMAESDGDKIRLSEIADVKTAFDRDQPIARQRGIQAIRLQVSRALSADTLKTMNLLEEHLAEAQKSLPDGLIVEKYDVQGKFVEQRLGILVNNGLQGLIIVLIVLFIFLDARIAFWVAAGIPVALMATLAVMWASGQTINMISMFALIMMLGIIVDDAIVVGEHTATRQGAGDSRLLAAERGATAMLKPVMAATLTTQAAFLPIFLISGRIGDVMSAIPLVVFAVLIASLIECFLILPGHLRHGFGKRRKEPSRFRQGFDSVLNRFRDGPYRRFVQAAYNWRYTTVAFTFASLIFAFGLIAGGRVGFQFFPSPEPENLTAAVTFGAGTPRADQIKALDLIEAALDKAEKALVGNQGRLVETSFTTLGVSNRAQGDNLSQIEVQLTPSEVRTIPTKQVVAAWRKALPAIPGVEKVSITGRRAGPPGRDLDIQLQDAPVADLKAASIELSQALTRYPGVSAVTDDLPFGRRELILEVTQRGAALGFTSQTVGQQIRNAFQGAIATRFARGDEEITVRVKRVQEVPGPHALKQIYLKSPGGVSVPLTEVVSLSEKAGFSIIQRKDGLRTVSITGNIDAEVNNLDAVLEGLKATVLPELAKKYNLSYAFKGRAEERAESFADLKLGGLMSLTLIYIILAWVFESYARPFAVMAIIPFGIVGAILGHMVMGFNLTIISMIGLLGLSGILVNDSIILVSQVGERLKKGNTLAEAAVGASEDRFRAVLLTSLTTIGGLLPLLFETSRQAQFLLPMAITLVFGLAAATVLVLILVPSLIGIGGDIGRASRGLMFRLGVGAGNTAPS